MATKKRLSDLVREEVKKQADDDMPAAGSAASKSEKNSATSKPQAFSATVQKSVQQSSQSSDSAEIVTLKSKLAALEKENKALQSNNAQLLTKLESLERVADKAKATEKALQAVQSKQQSMLVNLDEARQDALKLAQENQKLIDQIKHLEAKATQPSAMAQRESKTVQPVRTTAASQSIQRTATRQSPVVYKAPAKKPFSRPVSPSRLPPGRVVQNSDEFETWCYD